MIQTILHKVKQLIGVTTLILMIVACEQSPLSDDSTTDPVVEKVRVEIFARAQSYDQPAIRALADEKTVSMKPWVLVFKGSGDNATFIEAVQAFEMVSKRYVLLTPQSGAAGGYQLLILANPMGLFYYGNATTGMTYNISNLTNTLTTGVTTLKQVCDNLLSEPLAATQQTVIPFSGAGDLIPMSYLLPLTKIDNSTQIANSDGTSLKLVRTIAKMSIVNKDDTFVFEGIMSVANVPRQGRIHKLGNGIMDNRTHLTTYRKDASYSQPIITAIANSTETTPVYLYESNIQNNTYFIIRGTYNSQSYYYKMAIVNSTQQSIDIVRNASYTFNIIKAKGPGYDTMEDAIASTPSNTNLDYRMTVDDGESYEIMANNDYYLGVSNSVYIVYGGNSDYEAFKVITDCSTIFPNSNKIEDNRSEADWAFYVKTPTTISLKPTGDSNPRVTAVNATISDWLMWYEEGQIKYDPPNDPIYRKNAYIMLTLGNLKKNIHIRQRGIIDKTGSLLTYQPVVNNNPSLPTINYYCLSAQIEDGTSTPKSWIKLLPSSGIEREDAANITVDNGIIKISVLPNNTGSNRSDIVYMTTVKNPNGSNSDNSMQRIKINICQAG